MILTAWLVSLLIFIMMEVVPGDVARMILGQFASDNALSALRQELGLDLPVWHRYPAWLAGVLQGDFGNSLYFNVPIVPLLLRRLENSLILAGFAGAVAIPISIAVGVIAGLRRGKVTDHALSITALAMVSMPEFLTGMGLIIVFSGWLDWLPPTSMILGDASPLDSFKTLILPVTTLTLGMIAYISRMARASVVEVMQTEYIRMAVLKGMRWHTVVFKHALRNALLPTITVIAVYLGWLVGGLIVVETVFGYPGIGSLLLVAIKGRDVPLLEAIVLIIVLAYLLSSMFADILYVMLNPRIRYK
jgi:peptide/nickel transport system permease protein